MVNWNRGLLIQGVKTVIMVSIHALGLVESESTRIKVGATPSC